MTLLFIGDETPVWLNVSLPLIMLVGALWARNKTGDDFREMVRNNVVSRCLGLIVIAAASWAIFYFCYEPVRKVQFRQDFKMPQGVLAIAAYFIMMGLTLLIAGSRYSKFFPVYHGQRMTPLQKIVCGVSIAIGIGLELGFRYWIRSHGYTFRP